MKLASVVTYEKLLPILGAMILAGLGILKGIETAHAAEMEKNADRVFQRLERIEGKVDRILER